MSTKIDDFRGVKFLRVFIRANENYSVAFYSNCFSFRLFVVLRVDVSIGKHEIDILSANHCSHRKCGETGK